MTNIRRFLLQADDVRAERGRALARPLRRVAAVVIARNPLAGRDGADLAPLARFSRRVAPILAGRALAACGGAVEGYGKAAVVGTAGELEHAAALMHILLVPALRRTLTGSVSLMPATKRVADGTVEMTVPLGHVVDAWSPDHWDSLHLRLDALQPDEMALILAVSGGPRPFARCGDHRPAAALTATERSYL